jgi:GST-like protein
MFLEEAELDYTIHPVDISACDQFAPDFLRISPNNRIPAIVSALHTVNVDIVPTGNPMVCEI